MLSKIGSIPLGQLKPFFSMLAPVLGMDLASIEKLQAAMDLAPEIMPEFFRWLETERPDLAEKIKALDL
jgi:hypothetical protein